MSASTNNNDSHAILNSGIHDFIEIMCDGSVRLRTILASDSTHEKVDISAIMYLRRICESIYTEIFGKDFCKIFVYAQKYERLAVIKQFVPCYKIKNSENTEFIAMLNNSLSQHIKKYGNNLMIENSRLPKSDYYIIDKRWFDTNKMKYNLSNLVEQLFHSEYYNLGFIEPIKV